MWGSPVWNRDVKPNKPSLRLLGGQVRSTGRKKTGFTTLRSAAGLIQNSPMPANPLDELSSHGIIRSPMKIVEYVAENRGASAITSVRTTAGADALT